jgi:glycyl-tRNA synthetase
VRARFADAAYFFRQDIQKPLDAYLPRLDTIIFQGKLGSMLDKSRRIESLIEPIAYQLGIDGAQLDAARKAAHLCKADLATNMVVEITALQGQMGRDYHKRTNTDADAHAVADAIFEHYLPRYSGDRSPSAPAGLVVGLADKLDSIAGLFAVGLAPKGSADPFALRRAAIGIVTNLLHARASFSLRRGLDSAAGRLPVPMDDKARDAAHAFIVDRARVIFEERGARKDVVDAVLAEQSDDPHSASTAIAALDAAVRSDGWPALLAAFARCARILRSAPPPASAGSTDPQPEAQALARAVDALSQPSDAASLLHNLAILAPSIQSFFDKTMVMAEDPALRDARLSLLGRIIAQTRGIADLSRLEGF